MGRGRSCGAGAAGRRGHDPGGTAGAAGRQAGEIQMAAQLRLLAGTAEIRLRQGDEARDQAAVAGGRVMSEPVESDKITDYHMHVYYDAGSRDRAALLRGWVESRF